MNSKRILMLPMTFWFVICQNADAAQASATDIRTLLGMSDVVVRGQVVNVAEIGRAVKQVGPRSVEVVILKAEMLLDRVILDRSNSLNGRKLIEVEFALPTKESMGYGGLAPKSYRIAFLKRKLNVFELVYAQISSYPAVRNSGFEYANPIGAVIGALTAVLGSGDSSHSDRIEAIRILMNEPRGDRLAEQALEIAANNDTDAKSKWFAVEVLLNLHHDLSVLPLVTEELISTHPTTSNETRTVLANAVGNGARDPRAIPLLVRMLGASDVRARRGATKALGHMGSMEAKDALISALYDSDPEVRYNAVFGLASIAGPDEKRWWPSRERYLADESKYLIHWREWAKANITMLCRIEGDTLKFRVAARAAAY